MKTCEDDDKGQTDAAKGTKDAREEEGHKRAIVSDLERAFLKGESKMMMKEGDAHPHEENPD